MQRSRTILLVVLAVGAVAAGAALRTGQPDVEEPVSAPLKREASPPRLAVKPATSTTFLEDYPGPDAGSLHLPDSAPKSVRFGVVLIVYDGADGVRRHTRSRDEARRLAEKLLPDANRAFGEAVKRGDPGSTDDAGRIPRGILEPHLEYALFSLEPGQVHPRVLDTPRGFWILRRNK